MIDLKRIKLAASFVPGEAANEITEMADWIERALCILKTDAACLNRYRDKFELNLEQEEFLQRIEQLIDEVQNEKE